MNLYSKKLGKIYFDVKNNIPYDSGRQSDVYRYNEDKILKIYNDTTLTRLSYDVFNIIRHIDNPNFIKIYNVYKSRNNVFSAFFGNLYDSVLKSYIIDAYISMFYQKEDIDILNEPIDYTLSNFNELFKLFDIFTENQIEARDCVCVNTVFTKDRVIIIDPDRFRKSYWDKEHLKNLNRRELLKLFKNIYLVQCSYKYMFGIMDLFDLDDTFDMAYQLSKNLRGYKYPIDYLTKNN